jgi:hypothetical protein
VAEGEFAESFSRFCTDPLVAMRLLIAAIGVVAFCTALRATGADIADPLNKREPPRPDYLPGTPTQPFTLPPVERKPLAPDAAEQASLFVQRIVFRGNGAISTAELDSIAAPYRGRKVTAAEIEELRQALTRHYVERGYINSGALLDPDSPERTPSASSRAGSLQCDCTGWMASAIPTSRSASSAQATDQPTSTCCANASS